MNYTNKVIIFSEKNFGGDALVVMQDLEVGESKDFFFNDLNIKTSTGTGFAEYQKNCHSYINEKGFLNLVWEPYYGLGAGGAVHDADLSHVTGVLLNVFLKNEGRPYSIVDKPLDIKVTRTDYFLTFYPKLNAYFISPAPLCELQDGKFRWVLHDEDTFTIDWYADDVDYAYLEFFPHDKFGKPIEDRDRALPIAVRKKREVGASEAAQSDDHDVAISLTPLPQYIITRGEKIKIVKKTDGALWAFNFCCKIGDRIWVVDPETKYGSGTGNS